MSLIERLALSNHATQLWRLQCTVPRISVVKQCHEQARAATALPMHTLVFLHQKQRAPYAAQCLQRPQAPQEPAVQAPPRHPAPAPPVPIAAQRKKKLTHQRLQHSVLSRPHLHQQIPRPAAAVMFLKLSFVPQEPSPRPLALQQRPRPAAPEALLSQSLRFQ